MRKKTDFLKCWRLLVYDLGFNTSLNFTYWLFFIIVFIFFNTVSLNNRSHSDSDAAGLLKMCWNFARTKDYWFGYKSLRTESGFAPVISILSSLQYPTNFSGKLVLANFLPTEFSERLKVYQNYNLPKTIIVLYNIKSCCMITDKSFSCVFINV